MKKTLKCALFLTLIVLALFAMTMFGASAATHASDTDAVSAGDVVKVVYTKNGALTTEYYATVSAAVTGMGDAIADGATITVLDDISADAATTISAGTVTINGNGHTVTGLALTITGANVEIDNLKIVNSTAIAINVGGATLTMKNGSTITSTGFACINLTDATTINLSDVVLSGDKMLIYATKALTLNAVNTRMYVSTNNPCVQMTVAGNSITIGKEGETDTGVYFGSANTSSSLLHFGGSAKNSTVNIYGGTFISTNTKIADNCAIVNLRSGNVVNVYGGTFLSDNYGFFGAVSANDGTTLNISGGAIVSKATYIDAAGASKEATSTNVKAVAIRGANLGTVNISGTFDITTPGTGIHCTGAATVTITGTKENPITITACQSGTTYYHAVKLGGSVNGVIQYAELSGNYAINALTTGTITVSDSILTGTRGHANLNSPWGGAFGVEGSSKITATNCILHAKDGAVIHVSSGAPTIKLINCTGTTGTSQALSFFYLNVATVLDIVGGSYVCGGNDIMFEATANTTKITITGGYFETKGDMFVLTGDATNAPTLTIYGGYFHATEATADAPAIVRIGNGTNNYGTATIYGGTFVADYTDVGSVFSYYAGASTLNYQAFNGKGSASIVYDAANDIILMEQEASYTFNYNTLYTYGDITLRLNANGDISQSGLRFTSYVPKGFMDMISSLKDSGTEISYGTVVVPVKYLENVNYFSAESVMDALDISATVEGMREDEVSGGLFIRASIYNLPHYSSGESDMTYNDEYAFTVYAEYIKDGKTVRHYANFYKEEQTASPAYLAGLAARDLKIEEQGEYTYPVYSATIYYSKYSDNERAVINAYAADFAGVASVNGVFYPTLEEAIAAAGADDTIELFKDITLTAPITIDKKVTIDGKYCTLTMPKALGKHVFLLSTGSDLTVIDLNVINAGTSVWNTSVFKPSGAVTLTVNGGNYTAAGVILYGQSCSGSVVTLNAPNFTTVNASSGNAAPVLVNSAYTLVINGGTYTPASNTSTGNALRIMDMIATDKGGNGSVTVNGGTFNTNGGATAIYTTNALNLTISSNTAVNGGIVASIPDHALANRTDITSVVIPAFTTSIGTGIFSGCTNLESIVVESGNTKYHSAGNCLIETATATLLAGCKNSVIPTDGTVTSIAAEAFAGSGMESIIIPATVTSIGSGAFSDCDALASLTLPFVGATAGGTENTHFGYIFGAADYSTQAEVIPATLTTVTVTEQCVFDENAFANTTVTVVPVHVAGTTWQNDNTYHWHVCVRDGCLEPLEHEKHSYNTANTCTACSYVLVEDSLVYTFNSTTSTYSITGYNAATIPADLVIPAMYQGYPVTSIAASVFNGCTTLNTVTIPASITSIGSNAFNGCSALKGVYISDVAAWLNITFADKPANPLYNAKQLYLNGELLTDFVIPESVTAIKNYAFYHCNSMETVRFHAGVTSIGTSAFSGNNISNVYITDLSAWLKMSIANDTASPLYYSAKSTDTAALRNLYLNNKEITDLVIPEDIKVIPMCAFHGVKTITSLQLHAGVTEISTCAFRFNNNLKQVVFAADGKLTTIGYEAFRASGLTEVEIPASVTTLADKGSIFIDSTSLKTVTFAKGSKLTALPAYTFRGCTSLQTLALPEGITTIGAQSIKNCPALTTLVIPASVTTIDSTSFAETANVKNLTVSLSMLSSLTTTAVQNLTINAGTSIATSTFEGYTALKTVTILSDVTSIGDYAFSGCTSLTSVNIPDSVTSIGSYAFYYCSELVSISIPDGVTSLEEHTFDGCTSLTSVNIPDSVTSIGSYAFRNCSKLASISIPNGVTLLEMYTFSGCKSLTSITIPDSVISIGTNVFQGCSALKEMTIPFVGSSASSPTYTNFGYLFGTTSYSSHATYVPSSLTKVTVTEQCVFDENAFANTTFDVDYSHVLGNTWAYDGTYHWHACTREGCSAMTEDAAVHSYNSSNVCTSCSYKYENIGLTFTFDATTSTYTVAGYTGLPTEVVIPATYQGYPVTAIAANAFNGCTTLQSIEIPEGIISIGYQAFIDCSSLVSIYLPASLTTLAGSIFYRCTELAEVTFADGIQLTAIPDHMFRYCSKLTTLELPAGITSIGKYTLANCTSLTTLVIPASVTSINSTSFAQTTNVKTLTVSLSMWSNLTTTSVENLTINGGTSINGTMFKGNTTLKNLTIGATVTSIAKDAFNSCTSLETVYICEGMKEIGDQAFHKCTSLQSVYIPASVTTIVNAAFHTCSSLSEVIFAKGSKLTAIPTYLFSNCSSLTEIDLPDGITSIGQQAFRDCVALTAIDIPAGVSIIGTGAFLRCTSLKTVTIPSSLTYIEDRTFENCTALKNINITDVAAWCALTYFDNQERIYLHHADTLYLNGIKVTALSIPSDITAIPDYAFYGFKNITSVTIPAGVTSIGANAFRSCTSLASITFESYTKLKTIGERAFANCTALESFRMPTSVTSVGAGAFYWCESLQTVTVTDWASWCKISFADSDANPLSRHAALYYGTSATAPVTSLSIPTTVTLIGAYAFYNCDTLTTITIPTNVKSIGKSAFGSCDAITTVNAASTASWCSITFANATANPLNGEGELYIGGARVTVLTMPSTVTAISEWAFYGCDQLTAVNVTDLAAWCGIDFGNFFANPLYYAKNLKLNGTTVTALSIPATVTEIGDYAFVNGAFASVTVPATVTTVGANAFNNCSATVISAQATTLSYSSFAFCDALQTANIPTTMIRYLPKNTLTSVVITGGTAIPASAFENNTKLTSITIPATVTDVGVNAFNGCTALTNVYITDMAAWCAIDFDNAYANPLHKASNLYLNGSKVTSVSIPSGVTTISSFAFYGFKGITSVTIPASVTTIDSYAFANCTKLATVTFSGAGLTDIQSYAFSGCTALTTVAIPTTVTSIAPYAFSGAGLTSVSGLTSSFQRYATVSATSGTSTTLTAANLTSTYTAYWWKR